MALKCPDKFRIKLDGWPIGDNQNGCFIVKLNRGQEVRVIAGTGEGWEHVSVSRKDRCPTWDEMCQIKDLFWDAADWVVQYHPAESHYVNDHPHCLHLWRPTDVALPLPYTWMV
jgi:hypothetical protein